MVDGSTTKASNKTTTLLVSSYLQAKSDAKEQGVGTADPLVKSKRRKLSGAADSDGASGGDGGE